ncbi:MAG: NAD(P) transhydrogenase subunit alpha [Candidatus Hydrogenedentes bacterium]|nr:NAD(P) transhydrogenase subunit alpha [Candidatus Hydrogenedentota bacterium]
MGATLFVLLLFVVVCAVLGYKIIAAVPPLLHTPLMSGMNALSGITLLVALAALRTQEPGAFSWYVALAAIVLAMINVTGGYWVTERMLRMFKSDNGGGDDK